jgi:hypothetical protein
MLQAIANLPLDDWLPYVTVRTVKLRDWRLGGAFLATCLAIACYIAFTVICGQAWLQRDALIGSVNFYLTEPPPGYGSTFPGAPVYCLNGTLAPFDDRYTLPAPGYYRWSGNPPNQWWAQQPCEYWDEPFLLGQAQTEGQVFLPLRVITRNESLPPPLRAQCVDMSAPGCTNFTSAVVSDVLLAGVDRFFLTISHSFTTTAGISGGSQLIPGALLDLSGNRLSPCAVYDPLFFPQGCPPQVAATFQGPHTEDVLPVRALFIAAGLPCPDVPAGNIPSLSNVSARASGITLQLEITYTNYAWTTGKPGLLEGTGTLDSSEIHYYYTVRQVPDTVYRSLETVTPSGLVPALDRVIYERRGVRILVSQSGFIGNFNMQALLVTLTVSLGMLKVATLVVDFCATRVMRMRAIYGQYVTRTSVSLSEVRQADDQGVYAMFARDPHLVDPVPPVLREALDGRRRRAAERAALLAQTQAIGKPEHSAAASSSVDADCALMELEMHGSGPRRRQVGGASSCASATATTANAALIIQVPRAEGGGLQSPLLGPHA